jgi:dTDP-glucose 4,6-dehydratase
MNVVVTGGAGFIGANFLRRFVPRFPTMRFVNADAHLAANAASLADIEHAENYVFERIDITDTRAVEAFSTVTPQTCSFISPPSHVDRSIYGPRQFLRTNVDGTLNLLEAARLHASNLFHHVSTDEVCRSLGLHGFFTEETRYDPSSPYSASKAASDHLVRAWARMRNAVKITSCSTTTPIPFPEKLIPLTILDLIERKPIPVYGHGTNVRDWLYVDDHCDAIWRVIEAGRVGESVQHRRFE